MAASLADARGLDVYPGKIQAQARFAFQSFLRRKDDAERGVGITGGPIAAAYALVALDAARFERNDMVDALVQYLLRTQSWDGSWRTGYPDRPPLESSDFTATALSVRALEAYADGSTRQMADLRVDVARSWLVGSGTVTTEDDAFRLLGMRWAGAGGREIRSGVDALIESQRGDGGWAQESGMTSDAYATGQALVALGEGGELPTSDEVYRRGVAFLLGTQEGDGSWFVRSRDYPGRPRNPYFDSGFPHGTSQFISTAATSWAAMALILDAAP